MKLIFYIDSGGDDLNSGKQIASLQEIFSKRYGREFSIDEVKGHCIGIIYNGITKSGWKLNGVKASDLNK